MHFCIMNTKGYRRNVYLFCNAINIRKEVYGLHFPIWTNYIGNCKIFLAKKALRAAA